MEFGSQVANYIKDEGAHKAKGKQYFPRSRSTRFLIGKDSCGSKSKIYELHFKNCEMRRTVF